MKWIIVILLLLQTSIVMADDKVCFSPDEARKIVVEIKQSRISNEIIAKQEEDIKELKSVIEVLEKKIAVVEEANKKYEALIKDHEKLQKNMEMACDERVANARPGLLSIITGIVGSIGIGIIIGVLL